MKPSLSNLLLALCASPVVAQTAAAQVTRDQAMALPPDRLAELVLSQLGAQVQSVSRPNFAPSSDSRMISALQHLTFATAARATDTVGLCAANRIDVNFERAGADANEAATPVRVRDVRAAQVYKVVGEIEPDTEVSETRQAEEERRCAGAGPVVDADYSDRGRPHFFTFRGTTDLVIALRVLQRAIGEARAGNGLEIRCVAGPVDCRTQLGGLDLANLDHVSIGPLGVGGDGNLYRIEASFLIEGDSNYQHYRSVAIEAESAYSGQGRDPIRRLGRIAMSESEIYR